MRISNRGKIQRVLCRSIIMLRLTYTLVSANQLQLQKLSACSNGWRCSGDMLSNWASLLFALDRSRMLVSTQVQCAKSFGQA